MALNVFGVTPDKVRRHHFPTLSGFSASTTPDTDTVTEMIQSEAAELAGRLRAKGADASAITSDDNPAGYAWCADTIRVGAAARAVRAMPGSNPAVVKALTDEVDIRYQELDDVGLTILGDVAGVETGANAPRSYFRTGEADADEVARFRMDDEL